MAAMATTVPAYGDAFPKLLLVNPAPAAELRLLRALHHAGLAATDGGRDDVGQKLFGARIVTAPVAEWDHLSRFVRTIVAFGADGWASASSARSVSGTGFAHGVTVTGTGDRPVTVLACLPLDDPDLTDAALAELLASAQQSAGLSWGCGGSGR